LAEGENPAEGLTARAPGATDVSRISHVAGKVANPWISTTKSLAVATTKYGKFGVVGIDLSRVSNEIVDISGGFPETPGMFSDWAAADQRS
jgi:tRNA(Ser,Leu) C12 N-acetylase TAN1